MYEVYKEAGFSSAHRLREYEGKCEKLHGHNWKIRVFAAAEQLDSIGMVIDFKILKKHLEEVVDRLDHTDINTVPPFDVLNPSAENIAKYLYDELSKRINNERVKIARTMVWESDHSCAVYFD